MTTLRVPGRRYTLGLLVTVYAFHFMDRQILAMLAPAIQRDLGISDTQLGFLAGFAFAIFYTTLGIPLAVYADRGHRNGLIAVAVAVFSVMTALCGAAATFWQLALARIGVGVGEAGTNPASHSMIADLYPVHERSGAMAVFALGPQAGLVMGFLVAGWVSQWYGWRVAFLVAGVAGVLLAAIARLTLDEPPRTATAHLGLAGSHAALGATVRDLWRNETLRHLVAGGTLASALANGVVSWLPTFLVRMHGFQSGAAGVVLALVVGVGGGMGTFAGGALADRLARRDARWAARLPAVALGISAPLWVASWLVTGTGPAVVLLVVPSVLIGIYLGPTFALVQALVDPHRRALAAALILFVGSLIGIGLGPLAVGALSDALTPRLGADALRWALVGLAGTGLWAAAHYGLAARTLGAEAARLR